MSFFLNGGIDLFLSLFIILIFGVLGGLLFERIKLPKLIWYIILGILISPSVFNIIDKDILNISSYLRQIALIIILTRSGLSLDINGLKKIGRPAILMCFIPATFEIIGITIFGPIILNISIFESLLLGSVLAAVSPAIVAPRMINFIENNYGEKNHVPELVLAGASCDDIYVIVLFYSFKNLVATNNINYISILQIPISIVLGVLLGFIVGLILILTMKLLKLNKIINVIIILGASFGMVSLENILKPYFSISSLLGIIVMAILIAYKRHNDSIEIKKSYNALWQVFEILLFVLVGASIDIKYAFSIQGLLLIGVVFIGLIFRSIGVILSLIFTNYSKKEKIFIIISYLPKATVQASIGGIALMEGLSCGTIILTAAVISILITAPLGAILIDNLYKKLLEKEYD